AGAVGDEEKLLGARRVGGGFGRRAARVGDRPRRQAIDHIGVVAGLEVEIRPRDRTAEAAFAAHGALYAGRVRLQAQALVVPIAEHGRAPGAFLGLARFLLDDRGQDHELIGIFDWQIGRAPFPDLLDHSTLLVLHALDYLLARGAPREVIG